MKNVKPSSCQDRVECRAVAASDWPLIEALFGPRGACGGCWCMHWFAPPGQNAWNAMKGEANRTSLRRQIERGRCFAVLAVESGRAIGWCRAGPTGSFPRLMRSRKLIRDDMADWAVACFYVERSRRKEGLSAQLLRSAAELAASQGAKSIEGYPLAAHTDGIPAAFAWTGLEASFARAGFHADPHDAGWRRIYRLELEER